MSQSVRKLPYVNQQEERDDHPTTETLDVLIMPGVPGIMERLDSGEGTYPVTTTDVVKLLQEIGLQVGYSEAREQRTQIGHNAADIWLPVILFLQQTSWDVAVSYVTTVVTGLIGVPETSKRRLHVKVGLRSADGIERFFEGSGKARNVLAAMRQAGIDER